jgi:hypothetical protein
MPDRHDPGREAAVLTCAPARRPERGCRHSRRHLLEAERQFCMIVGFSDLAKLASRSSGNSPVPSPTAVASQEAAIVASA